MNYITTKDANSGEDVKLYYQDIGKGKPAVFIHGWPLSHEMWEYQVTELYKQGVRCISYDRRGFGKSSKPESSYDYDTLAADLNAVIEQLGLDDVTLLGFSMGGGEAVRYLSTYGTQRVSKIVLVSAVTPYMLKTTDNEYGIDREVFAEMMDGMKQDRIAFLDDFGKAFFGVNLVNHPVSAPLLEYYRTLASLASPIATQECAISFSSTDFRKDVSAIDIPTLIIHGDADKTVPIQSSGDRTSDLLPDAKYIVYEGEPHGLFYTSRDRLNTDLLHFINDEELVEENATPDSLVFPVTPEL
jgi:pimeloyl-ACP methyl ester carboxylesterase